MLIRSVQVEHEHTVRVQEQGRLGNGGAEILVIRQVVQAVQGGHYRVNGAVKVQFRHFLADVGDVAAALHFLFLSFPEHVRRVVHPNGVVAQRSQFLRQGPGAAAQVQQDPMEPPVGQDEPIKPLGPGFVVDIGGQKVVNLRELSVKAHLSFSPPVMPFCFRRSKMAS